MNMTPMVGRPSQILARIQQALRILGRGLVVAVDAA
jgi:hypothetical protein